MDTILRLKAAEHVWNMVALNSEYDWILNPFAELELAICYGDLISFHTHTHLLTPQPISLYLYLYLSHKKLQNAQVYPHDIANMRALLEPHCVCLKMKYIHPNSHFGWHFAREREYNYATINFE